MKTADKILIERYLDNTLSGGELQDFLHRLDNDEDFRRMVSTHNLLIAAFQSQEPEAQTLYSFVIAFCVIKGLLSFRRIVHFPRADILHIPPTNGIAGLQHLIQRQFPKQLMNALY